MPVALCVSLGACAPTSPGPLDQAGPGDAGDIVTDAQGRCFARAAGPTETTVVTELVEVVPEVRDADNTVVREAVFRNVDRPRTTRAGVGEPFETLCPQVYTSDFVASLQRALIVRQIYAGQVNGLYDAPTSEAVARFQRPRGIDSTLLSADVARELGLVALTREALN